MNQTKQTVYIPDKVWDLVKMKVLMEQPEISKQPSKILQVALNHFISDTEQDRPAYSRVPPSGAMDRIAQVRTRFSQETREQYERGFNSGIELAEQLSWAQVQDFHQIGWSFHEWFRVAVQERRIRIADRGAIEDSEVRDEDDEGIPIMEGRYITDRDLSDQFFAQVDASADAICKAYYKGEIYQTGLVDAMRRMWESVTGLSAPDGPWPERL